MSVTGKGLNLLYEAANFVEFIDVFKKKEDKLPKTIKRLVSWFRDNLDKMWVVRTTDNHLELTYNRPRLIRESDPDLDAARKIVQNFERCLNAVTPKLIVLESTHGTEIKRIGFKTPETIFGSARSTLSPKELNAQRKSRKS
jgi:hypothetical protein